MKKELSTKQLLSDPCRSRGVASGQRNVLHSGDLDSDPHLERKLSAIEAIEMRHPSSQRNLRAK
jgi:hypothetical protein